VVIILKISRHHEDMSVKMVDYIVDEHNIEIDPECLQKVKVKRYLQMCLSFH
jgi:hypothetical protein